MRHLALLLIPVALSSAGFNGWVPRLGLSLRTSEPPPATITLRTQPGRKLLAPVLSYTGLGAAAAGAAKLVTAFGLGGATIMGMPVPLATLVAVAAPACWMFVEFRFFGGGERVARIMGGNPADVRLTELTKSVARRAGLPPPAHVFEIPTDELNAFAAGFGPSDTTVAVTTGLRQTLSNKELEAVIAHEIGHIRHSDVRTNMHVAVAVAGLGGVYNIGRTLAQSDRRKGSRKKKNDGDSSIALGLSLMAAGMASRMVGHILQLSMSRRSEFDADRVAAELCGSDVMISALSKIQAAADKKSKRSLSTWFSSRKGSNQQQTTLSSFRGGIFSHAYISNGKSDDNNGRTHGFWSRMATALSTHPTTERRIAALQSSMKYSKAGR